MRGTSRGQHELRGQVSFEGLPVVPEELTMSINSGIVRYIAKICSYWYKDCFDRGKCSRREGKGGKVDPI